MATPADSASVESTAAIQPTSNSSIIGTIKCGTCPRSFRIQRDYNRHRKTHDRPYKCSLCQYRCALISDLDRHRASHENESSGGKFKCSWHGCSFRGTVRKDNLLRHVRKAHAVTNEINSVLKGKHSLPLKVSEIYRKSIENERTIIGQRALRIALLEGAASGDEIKVQQSLDNHIDLNIRDKRYQTPLFIAAINCHEAVVRLLVGRGADINARNDWNETPLSVAAKNGHEGVAKYLVSTGADVNTEDYLNKTPLSVAAENGHEGVAKYLVSIGADVNTKNRRNETPLSVAAENGHEEVVKCLVSVGADVNMKNIWGSTALDQARGGNHNRIALFLESLNVLSGYGEEQEL